MSLRKAAVLDLASAAYEVDAEVKRGVLKNVDGRWTVSEQEINDWLKRFENHEVVLIAASLSDEKPIEPRLCRTCGREFVGVECPHCRAARIRLRGQ
ncbi:MAG TPA: hypothetical protein VJG32_06465 [Anaerolineae bacterium]|nr:hypothetical protein [Anaerolineae bacterium]